MIVNLVYLPVKLVAWVFCWVMWRLFGVGRHGTATVLFFASFSLAILDAFDAAFDETKPLLRRAVTVFLLLAAAAATASFGQKFLESTAGLTVGTRKTLANNPVSFWIKLVSGMAFLGSFAFYVIGIWTEGDLLSGGTLLPVAMVCLIDDSDTESGTPVPRRIRAWLASHRRPVVARVPVRVGR